MTLEGVVKPKFGTNPQLCLILGLRISLLR
jgi:hypothetical protein